MKKIYICIILIIIIFGIMIILHQKSKHLPNTSTSSPTQSSASVQKSKDLTTLSKSKSSQKSAVNFYQKQADKICTLLEKSVKLYESQQIKEASKLSDNTYWQIYDNVLEIKYRPYVSPQYIFSVESKFHDLTESMTSPVTPKKIKLIRKKAESLCAEVNKEAKELEGNQ
ncbi:hypothetical protein [Cysteiniphilum halobium]|uniref:hypothetical protein n=1 Tax=Cysteiniphilum halobium TaxID=2219059 RepID=UPI000E64C823|nr:hypothetical protein [Cysteiniphilum halobium]